MFPYANYCVLFDTRFVLPAAAAQFLHAVVLSREPREKAHPTKVPTYLFPRHGNSGARSDDSVGYRARNHCPSREGYFGLFTAIDSREVYRNITISPFNWKCTHFIHMPITRS